MELNYEEPARFNPEQLEDLCNRIGEIRAEAEVALALHRISNALPKLRPLLEQSEQGFADAVDALVADAEMLGMSTCLLYTSPSPRDRTRSRMPSSA